MKMKGSQKKEPYLELFQTAEKALGHEKKGVNNFCRCFCNSAQKPGKETGEEKIRRRIVTINITALYD